MTIRQQEIALDATRAPVAMPVRLPSMHRIGHATHVSQARMQRRRPEAASDH